MNFGKLFEGGKNKNNARAEEELIKRIAEFEEAAAKNVTPNDSAGSTLAAARLREELDNLKKDK